ncbi:uncharacterized protein Dwil_GK11055 [Drosophila willistoni]|uniref:Arrestin-like N-terminal domain-containing protein n=1 Tax=Drosophila willistoni TaxID=7260 RepID=B4N8C0_DROWI|nr:arrestin domain-containing protein 2 [Drosophila willistoni]EDW81371.1 uncharacterized protein Dwil_GK11055 [Drosophila willistoni]
MVIKCQFNLSRSAGVYYTGEQILGSVALSVGKKPVQVEGIKITLLGLTTVNWKESVNGPPQIEHNDCSSQPLEPLEMFYKSSKTLIEYTQQLTDALLLLPGKSHLASYDFQLPQSLPATCRLSHGSTNYILKVNLERQGKHVKSFHHRLIVKKCINFNDLRPQTKDTCHMSLKMSRSVFVPGQSVGYELQTNLPQPYITRLCHSITYQSEVPCRKSKNVITVLDESSEMCGELRLPLTAPIMTAGEEDQEEAIQISYLIETLYTDRDCRRVSLQLPVYVGTIAPPMDSISSQSAIEAMSLCFVNFALHQNELFMPMNQLLAHSCSRELNVMTSGKHCEGIKLLQCQQKKKKSYIHMALRYFHKTILQ